MGCLVGLVALDQARRSRIQLRQVRPLWSCVQAAFSWSWCWAWPWATPMIFASKGSWGRDYSIPAALTRDNSIHATLARDCSIPAALTRDHSIPAALTRDRSIPAALTRDCSINQGPQHPHNINQGPQHPCSINQAAFSELLWRERAPCSDLSWSSHPCMADVLHCSHLPWTTHGMDGPRAWL